MALFDKRTETTIKTSYALPATVHASEVDKAIIAARLDAKTYSARTGLTPVPDVWVEAHDDRVVVFWTKVVPRAPEVGAPALPFPLGNTPTYPPGARGASDAQA